MNSENAKRNTWIREPIVVSIIIFMVVTVGSILLATPLTGLLYQISYNWEAAVPFIVFGSLASIIYSVTWNERNLKKENDIRRSIWKYYIGLLLFSVIGAWINPDVVELNKDEYYSKLYNQTYVLNRDMKIAKSNNSEYLEFIYHANPVNIDRGEGVLLRGTPITIRKITRDNSTYRRSVEFIAEIQNAYIRKSLRLSDLVYDTEAGDFETRFMRRAKGNDEGIINYNPYDSHIIDDYNAK